MKISVITVCYNSALTLERAIKSVAEQNWESIEHIAIDGASADGCVEILKRFSSSITHIVSEPDKGIYDAMNKGLALATGDVICFLNADDQYVSANVLTRVASQMKSENLDALIGDVGYFDAKNPKRIIRRYRSRHFRPSRLEWGWMPAHPALFLRKEVVKRVGQFKTDYNIAGDFEFIVRTFHGHSLRYQYLPEVLVNMQTGGVSSSGWRARVKLNQEVLRACRENGLQTNMLKILSKYPLKLLELII